MEHASSTPSASLSAAHVSVSTRDCQFAITSGFIKIVCPHVHKNISNALSAHTTRASGLGASRYVVEQTIGLLHQFRRLRNRFDKRDDIHEAFLSLACSIIRWRRLNHGYFEKV
jgi:hypothetical protein